jgi:V/A-type H+-transporting ATPase subunit I
MFLGMGIRAYLMIRDGDVAGAVFDVGSWYLVFIGIFVMALGSMNAGVAVTLIGVLMLILTQGRHQKNIFKKLLSGISSLYDITTYLSDLMSYSRLLALGLATGVIAGVVNIMGSMAGGGVKGAIILIIVFVVGHLFNFFINALGTFVHASRLQYVEFFNRFYEGGGIPFEPFTKKTKYHRIVTKKEA